MTQHLLADVLQCLLLHRAPARCSGPGSDALDDWPCGLDDLSLVEIVKVPAGRSGFERETTLLLVEGG